MEIIPGILAKNPKQLREQLKKVTWAKKIHIDIMDGLLVPNKTIAASALKKMSIKQKIQVHLMAKQPEKYLSDLIEAGASEIIIHAESTKRASEIMQFIKIKKIKAGIALNPQTRPSKCKDAIKTADTCLLMTVTPGFAGQKFKPKPLSKIKQVKKINSRATIGIDGGINTKTCGRAKTKGADFCVATSSCTFTKNPKQAYKELQKCK
jgi:ribulose-phosphate 3-epimerase